MCKKVVDSFGHTLHTHQVAMKPKLKKEVRMLMTRNVMSLVVKAKLLKSISYQKDGIEVLIPSGTSIQVDVDRLIALVGNDHTDVSSDEFQVSLPN